MLEFLFGNRTAVRVLLFLEKRHGAYATEISQRLKIPLNMVQKQLERFERGGVLVSDYQRRRKIYRWNRNYPLLKDLKRLLTSASKHLQEEYHPPQHLPRFLPERLKTLRKLFFLTGLLLLSGNLVAQDTGISGTNLEFYRPSIDSYGYFGVNSPRLMKPGQYHLKISQSWAGNHLFQIAVGILPVDIVDHIYTTNFVGSVGISKFLTMGIDIPVHLSAREADFITLAPFSTRSVGDIRLALKFRLLEEKGKRPGLALLFTNTFPTGNERNFLGTSHMVPGLELLVGKQLKYFDFAVNIGARFPQEKDVLGLKFNDQITYGAAVKVPFGFWDPLFSVIGEVRGHFDPGRAEIVTSPIEFTAGFQKEFKNGLILNAGAGGAWNNAIGNPRFRALFSISYSPPRGRYEEVAWKKEEDEEEEEMEEIAREKARLEKRAERRRALEEARRERDRMLREEAEQRREERLERERSREELEELKREDREAARWEHERDREERREVSRREQEEARREREERRLAEEDRRREVEELRREDREAERRERELRRQTEEERRRIDQEEVREEATLRKELRDQAREKARLEAELERTAREKARLEEELRGRERELAWRREQERLRREEERMRRAEEEKKWKEKVLKEEAEAEAMRAKRMETRTREGEKRREEEFRRTEREKARLERELKEKEEERVRRREEAMRREERDDARWKKRMEREEAQWETERRRELKEREREKTRRERGLKRQTREETVWRDKAQREQEKEKLQVEKELRKNAKREAKEREQKDKAALKRLYQQIQTTVYFRTGGRRPTRESSGWIDEAAELLKRHRKIKKVVIEGHTDSLGGRRQNRRLSVKRAEAVKKQFLRQGVDPERIEVQGFGEEKPAVPNKTPQGRRLNRRVEISVKK